MLRLGTLLFFAVVALGQVPRQPAYVSIDIGASGEVNATLTVPVASPPAALPATFAHAVGCDMSGVTKSYYRIQVQCATTRTSALTFHAAFRLSELAPQLLEAGVEQLNLDLTAFHFSSLQVDPAIPSDSGIFGGHYRAQYPLDPLPPPIVVDGGFGVEQVRTLTMAALAMVFAPFLLLLLRPSDPLRLRVYGEAISVLGWIGWIWALLHADGGALLSYAFGKWFIAPLLVMLAPPLVAVWIGSRLSAIFYERVAASTANADYYARIRFWSGAATACAVSTLLSFLLRTFEIDPWSLLAGIVLTSTCLLCVRRISRGKSHSLTEGDLRQRAFDAAARAGVKLRGVSILTSPTPRPPLALATRWGVVILNQGLLSTLSRREVDAVVCHELSHLGPSKKSALWGVYALLVVSILATQWIPHFEDLVPLALVAIYFGLKLSRRGGEWKADLDSVRWSGDPEALITGLTRFSRAHGMPLEWSAPISWMMAHPPTMERIRAIARAGSISNQRVSELLEESKLEPADRYLDAPTNVVAEDAAFSPVLRKRLQSRLTAFALTMPILLGLPAALYLQRLGLPWWNIVLSGSLLSEAIIHLGSDWIVGSIRETVKRRALTRHGQGVFAGLSPSPEPRLFDGGYHYDMGMVRFVNGSLEFAGDRANITLDPRLVKRVWLGPGPRHWMRRKVVYIECRPSTESPLVIFSLQSFEAWFWPWTTAAARKLFQMVAQWHSNQSAPPPTPALPCPLPQVKGSPVTVISLKTAFRSISVYSGIAFFLASVLDSLNPWAEHWSPSNVFCPMAVCGLLAFFMVCPRLNWSRFSNMTGSQARVPADS
jgi:Zn-dependent protease with chaperone function